jgi:hypothetical protein
MKNANSRVIDYAIYLTVSLLVIGIIVIVAEFGFSWDTFAKWATFTAMTLLIFGQFIFSSRALWKQKVFWTFVGASSVVHCGIYIFVLLRMEQVKPQWFLRMLIELVFMLVVRSVLLRELWPGPEKSR